MIVHFKTIRIVRLTPAVDWKLIFVIFD